MEIDEVRTSIGDIRSIRLYRHSVADLEAGEVRLAVDGFALSANNVTYAATGPVIGYWKFFPTFDPAEGIVPVWGFARVIESRSPHLAVGERIYGFLPMASHLTLLPEPAGERALIDRAAHRRDLPPVYNLYQRCKDHDSEQDASRAIFQPLLVTSWLLYDFLKDNACFDAQQVIIGSASSKTGLGLAWFLAEQRPGAIRIVGLTSTGNKGFVAGLAQYDQAVAYSDIEQEIADIASVYVDMSGNTEVRRRLHRHLGDNMKHSAAVGTSHWDRFQPGGGLPGARPRFFFAPAQIEKRRSEWPAGEVEQRMQSAWQRAAADCLTWMKLETGSGLEAACTAYMLLADGKVPPDTAHYIRL